MDVARGASIPLSLEETYLATRPRAELVAELICDPLYSDGRLLSRLSRQKLARMVSQSRERSAAAAAAPERRRA